MRRALKMFAIAATLAIAPAAYAEQPPPGPIPTAPPAERLDQTHPQELHAEGDHGAHADPSHHFNWFKGIDLSYKKMDIEGGPLGDNALGPDKRPLPPGTEETSMSVPFVLVLVNFGILLILIGWKAGPIARNMAEKRSDEIKGALDEAARLRAAAATKLDEYSTKLRAAEAEIDEMIKGMRDDAEAEKQRIIAAAEAQAAALKKEAEERIAAEIVRARATLQREVAAAAAEIAERLIRDKSTASDQATLVDSFIRDVGARRAGAHQETT